MAEAVADPTWFGEIRNFFRATPDIKHMASHSLLLASYDDVKLNADSIFSNVSQGTMPPDEPWPDDKVQTFLNWMKNGYKMGVPAGTTALRSAAEAVSPTATRIRKEIRDLSDDEFATLTTAFQGIMAMDITAEQSYFVQAGWHWLPGPALYCQHHVNKYLPWHRAYLRSFEDALRSVPGCENVTIPYWNFEDTSDSANFVPARLRQAPFDTYVLPEDVGEGITKGMSTQRAEPSTVLGSYQDHVFPSIATAFKSTVWEGYNGFAGNDAIMHAHDMAHNYVGTPDPPDGPNLSMANQDVAAFDPIFWFFHANWDRLWWKWQQEMDATTLQTFLTTVTDPKHVAQYQDPAEMNLPPFAVKTDATIDLVATFDTDYLPPSGEEGAAVVKEPELVGSTKVAHGATFATQNASIRVKGINRLKIPGSFMVHLLKDGESIAQRGFFQSSNPGVCANCVENSIVNFDFVLPVEQIEGGRLGVWIEPNNKDFIGDRMPLKMVGDPTINARLLLSTE